MSISRIAKSIAGYSLFLTCAYAAGAQIDGCWSSEYVSMTEANGSVFNTTSDCLYSIKSGEMLLTCDQGKTVLVASLKSEGPDKYSQKLVARISEGKRREMDSQAYPVTYTNVKSGLHVEAYPPVVSGPSPKSTMDLTKQSDAICRSCIAEKLAGGDSPCAYLVPAVGKYGAPTLMDFQVGARATPALYHLRGIAATQGFEMARMDRVSDPTGTTHGFVAYKGMEGQGRTQPGSYLVLLFVPGSTVNVIVRGETLANKPLRDDFAALVQTKFNAPPWVIKALTDTDLSVVGKEAPFWAVANGKSVRLEECFASRRHEGVARGVLQQSVGSKFISISWPSPSLSNQSQFRSDYCQYAVFVQNTTRPIFSGSKTIGEQVVDYTITMVDMQQVAADVAERRRDQAAKDQSTVEKVRKSAVKPNF